MDKLKIAIDLLKEATKSYECYSALHKPKEEWDEYDYMMYPIWIRISEFLDENG